MKRKRTEDECKVANREAQRRYQKKWYLEKREEVLARVRASYQIHKEQRRAYAKTHRASLSPEERRRRERINKLITKYKIRPEWYDEKMREQNNACAICLAPFLGLHSNRTHEDIDHDHRTGLVRGILCRACNMAIHKMDKDIAWAEKAVAYLQRNSTNTSSAA